MILTPKRSTETVLYSFPWADKLLGGDLIETFTLTRTAGTVVLTGEENLGDEVTALIAGGIDGEVATLSLSITTAAGQILIGDYSLTIADTATAIVPSTATKQTVVEMATEELTLAGYEFDPSPEETASNVRKLDALMAEQPFDIGYNFPQTFGGSDPTDQSGLPDWSINTVATLLAQRMMPAYGKSMANETRVALARGLSLLYTRASPIPDRQLPAATVRGMGNGQWRGSVFWPFTGTPVAS